MIVTAVFITTGCASAPPPVEQMAVSRAAVESANSAGANEFAPVLLKSAMDKLAAAELAMTKKDYVNARQLAEQAQVDAQLAVATARSVKAKKAAETVRESSRVLRKEIKRQTE
jgi:hypothetical protein